MISEKVERMLVKFTGNYGSPLSVLKNHTYKCIAVYPSWYRVIDETYEDYLYPKADFEVIDDSDAVYVKADKCK